MTTHYGVKVKDLRTRRAWPQEQLAAAAGINVRTIQRIEHGGHAAFETLMALANAFEVDVSELLAAPPPQEQKAGDKPEEAAPSQRVEFLRRVRTGRELLGVSAGTHMAAYDHDELQGAEVDLVASALQELHDCSEMWDEIEPAERVRITHDLTARIKELEDAGLWVFAGARWGTYRFDSPLGEKSIKMETATVLITRSTNPAIIRLDGEDAALPVAHRNR
jgi:transcriptional regulator with XRE-family HTH domain